MLIQVIDTFGGQVIGTDPQPGDLVRITKDNGAIVEQKYYPVADNQDGPAVYLHVDITGGDNRIPVGIINDGVSSATVTATLRQTADPGSDPITAVDNFPWRFAIRDSSGAIYDIVQVTFTAGTAVLEYNTTFKPEILTVSQKDLTETIGGARIVLASNPVLKVYRSL